MTSEEFLVAGGLRERVVRKPVGSGGSGYDSSLNTTQQQQQQQQQHQQEQDEQNDANVSQAQELDHLVKAQGRTPDGTCT